MRKIEKVLLTTCVVLCTLSCSDDLEIPSPQEAEKQEQPDRWHDKTRTRPYPKMENELYLNPAPLIIPKEMKTNTLVQFALSRDADFKNEATFVSEPVQWCMYNPHRELQPGVWYWRYRQVSASMQPGEWSDAIQFEVKSETPVFVTPAYQVFRNNLPKRYPRIYSYLNPYIGEARKKASSHPEYKDLIARAKTAMETNYASLIVPFSLSGLETVAANVEYLYQAWMITQSAQYMQKMEEILTLFIDNPYSDQDLFKDNFASTNIAYSILAPYDALHGRLSAEKKQRAEDQLMRVSCHYFGMYCGMQENHIFDNHFWQKNMRVLFQVALCMYDNNRYSQEMLEILEYYYELWTARAPASGFNTDGAWINGTGYFEANVFTLHYMPLTLSYITGEDFLLHPWYRNAGQSLVYSWPPHSKSTGFGDGSEKRDAPGRQRAAFADFLARESGDAYAGWYAGECADLVKSDVEMRLYRMSVPGSYTTSLPANAPKIKWYKDIGEVVMHSDLGYPDDNITLSFRSSTFGSGSHTLADQNSFNLLHGGKKVYYHTGYYINFSDAHNLMSYRHTRAHNTILVNGIGQPFSTNGYGMVTRAGGGENISYCIGDASQAYRGTSDDEMWIKAFEKAGITQTPEFGFGSTPLTKYRRQMLMLHPDIVVIYDELEASSPVRWEWLLHSDSEFDIHDTKFTTRTGKGGKAVATMFAEHNPEVSQTDKFAVAPTPVQTPDYPNQWHLTAAVREQSKCRLLTVIQVIEPGKSPLDIKASDGTIECGKWKIEACLDSSRPEKLFIKNVVNGAVYSYGSDHPSIGGETYQRKYVNSSVLYDKVGGKFVADEQTDAHQVASRR